MLLYVATKLKVSTITSRLEDRHNVKDKTIHVPIFHPIAYRIARLLAEENLGNFGKSLPTHQILIMSLNTSKECKQIRICQGFTRQL